MALSHLFLMLTCLAATSTSAPPSGVPGSSVGALPEPQAPPPAAPAFAVETLQGQRHEGRLTAWDGKRLTLLGADGKRQALAADELLLVTALTPAWLGAGAAPSTPVAAAARPDLLVLADAPDGRAGDRLWGRLVGGDPYGVHFSVEGSATFEVPFERIGRLLPRVSRPVDQLMRLAGAGRDDRAWRSLPDGGLDGPTGVVDRVGDDSVVLDGALGPLAFPLDELLAVVFGDTEGVAAEPPGLPVVLRLAGGSRLTAGLLELDERRLVLATQFADRLELPLESLTSLLVRSPRVVALADLEPVAVEQWPSIGTPDDFLFPWRRDLSVTGRVLSVDGVPRASGLGVHANARLTYQVPVGARALRVGVGLVDETAELPARGTVDFAVRAGDALLAESGPLAEGAPSAVLRVGTLPAGGRIELVCLDGGDDDAGDRAAWFDGVFLLGDVP